MADYYLQFSEVVANLTEQEEKWLRQQLQLVAVRGEQETEIDDLDHKAAEHADWTGPRFLRDSDDFDPACDTVGFQHAFHDDHDTPNGWGRHLWVYADDSGNPEHVAWLVQKFLRQFRPQECWSLSYATTCSKPRAGEFGVPDVSGLAL
jgi:hypothetical protein